MLRVLTTFWVIFGALVLLFSCEKPQNRPCLKSFGSQIIVKKELGDFAILDINDVLNIELIRDSVNYVEINGGANVVNFIGFEIENGTLIIKDNNKCNFSRSFKNEILLKIHYKNLNKINFRGAGKIYSNEIIKANVFEIIADQSSGTVDLDVDVNEFYSKILIGTADINIKGNAVLSYAYNGSFGFINHQFLKTKKAISYNNGSGDINIYSDSLLNIQIKGTGNVNCFGSPIIKNEDVTGKGKVNFK